MTVWNFWRSWATGLPGIRATQVYARNLGKCRKIHQPDLIVEACSTKSVRPERRHQIGDARAGGERDGIFGFAV